MFKDGEPEGLEYIFGDLSSDSRDRKPTVVKSSFRRVKGNKAFRTYVKAMARSMENPTAIIPLVFATPSSLPETVQDSFTFTETEIPDPTENNHPLYGKNPDINYEDATPEQEAMDRVQPDNVVNVDQETIEEIETLADKFTNEMSPTILKEGAALAIALDQANAYSTAVIRDGLGVEIEFDDSVQGVLSHMLRLRLIEQLSLSMGFREDTRDIFLEMMTEKIVGDAHTEMTKNITGQKYSSEIQNLVARVRRKVGTDLETDLESNTTKIGASRSRSRQMKRHTGTLLTDTARQHNENEQQDKDTRFG